MTVGAFALIAVLTFQFLPAVQDQVFAAGARRLLARESQLPTSDEALRVLLCGTSCPLPLRQSAKACRSRR